MSGLDGLLGRVLTDDVEIELSAGINFKNGMVASLNPATNLTEVSFGAGVDHGDMQIADGIHGTFWKTFLNQADRRAFPLVASYLGRRALQLSDATVWDVLPVPGSSPQTYTWGMSCAGPEVTRPNWAALVPGIVGIYEADLGLHVTGAVVNTWDNQYTGGGAVSNITEHTGTAGIGNVGTGVDGHPSITPNGTTQAGDYTLALSAPATNNVHFIAIQKVGTSNVTHVLTADGGFGMMCWRRTSAGGWGQYNGSVGPESNITLGTWVLTRNTFTGSTADESKAGTSTVATSTSSGNGAGSGTRHLFWDGGSNYYAGGELCTFLIAITPKATLAAAMPGILAAASARFPSVAMS